MSVDCARSVQMVLCDILRRGIIEQPRRATPVLKAIDSRIERLELEGSRDAAVELRRGIIGPFSALRSRLRTRTVHHVCC